MVKNPGATARPGAIKLLNQPEPVQVATDPAGRPSSVSMRTSLPARSKRGHSGRGRVATSRISTMQTVAAIDDRWKVNDEWWRGPNEEIERMYYSLLLESGHKTVVYQDMKSGSWFRSDGTPWCN